MRGGYVAECANAQIIKLDESPKPRHQAFLGGFYGQDAVFAKSAAHLLANVLKAMKIGNATLLDKAGQFHKRLLGKAVCHVSHASLCALCNGYLLTE